jgi:hypothetical protein
VLDGTQIAANCEAIDEAVRQLDEVIGELRKPLTPSIRGARSAVRTS